MNSPPNNPRSLSEINLDNPMDSKLSSRLRERAYSDAHAIRYFDSTPFVGAEFVSASPSSASSPPPQSSQEKGVAAAAADNQSRAKHNTDDNNSKANIKISPRKSHHSHATVSSRPRSKSESESMHLHRARTSPILKKKIHPVHHHDGRNVILSPPPHGHNFIPMNNHNQIHVHNHNAKHSYKSCGKMWIRPSPVGRHPNRPAVFHNFKTAKKRVDGSTSPDSVSDLGNFHAASSSDYGNGNGGVDAIPYLPLLHFSPNSSFDPVVPSSPGKNIKTKSDAMLFAFGESGKPIKPSSSSSTFKTEGFRPLGLADSASFMEL
mmetsp:Transcript_13927/g.29396  ORF Transcript_13927/g.29396 Transcript_13927/m.29396 type:complete len:320 (+) Transcript_13927:220-1179(+)|eukprot:CAMPEP_0171332102 /NCGR_PEP_ID=MMETSP0878-20121228/3160_1 /TAXON_ID=67004 /ORGANISM="Thalassiosira weissflogii, Strain CCMP1336" /LENGTH=319 /DNA_ID=CAMNT_0011832801 /DNA_START=157 /DNA_END=1116 /DNA_ORIENTATION=+